MGIIITFRGLTWCFSSSSSSELEDGQDIQTNWKRDFRELFYSFHRHYHRYHHRNMSRIDIIIIFWTRGWTGNPNKLATGFLRQRALSAWTSEARTRERFFKLFWFVSIIIIIIISTLDIRYLSSWLVGQKALVWEKEGDASSSDLTPSLHPYRHHRHHHQHRRQRNHHQFFTFTFRKCGGLLMAFNCFKFYATSPYAYIWSSNI